MNGMRLVRFHNHTFWGMMLFVVSMALPMTPKTVPRVNLQIGSQIEKVDGIEGREEIEQRKIDTIECIDCNPLIFGERLDINRASIEHLRSLPQIGPSRAQAIVDLRQERGGFQSIEELDDVRGIGPKTLLKLMPYISTEPE
jgi:competence ComEA-like helix-hairpin-helix protein